MSIQETFLEHARVSASAAQCLPPVLEQIIATLVRCLRSGGKVLACGNGGSASDAQHFVAELVGRYREERAALPAIALNADSTLLTAVANDYGYERAFARQVEALAHPGDVLVAISTSGNSANVLAAAAAARARGCPVIALTGERGGHLAGLAEPVLRAPSNVVARIQEIHGLCVHIIVEAVEAALREAPPR